MTACATEISGKCCYNVTCFDCSICLESAVEPVVTLCGHLYCWPCISKWMRVDSASASGSAPHCPVCRAPVSENALIALYARGGPESNRDRSLGLPSSPNVVRPEEAYGYGNEYCASVLRSTGGEVLLGLAVAVNPLVSRHDGSRFIQTRQVMVVEEALHQIWIFLFFCAVFCLLFF